MHLPAVPTLSKILAAGSEGGKEFGRIVGLLLFNDAKQNNIQFNLFNDSAGDYEGLDSYSRKQKSKDVTGYQYKFFSSPFSDKHRQEIKSSLENATTRSKKLKLEKWVLVTPDDLINSGRKSGGGDVEWFENLSEEYKNRFEIEHFGHSKLQSLFLQNQHLCLFYYPSLVPSGIIRKKSIDEIRFQYDENMRKRYGKIEFVGMSVYKEEASQRIPLENIYIPLSVVPERSVDENDETPRINPTKFLAAGSKTVILGDPGSGKSTMLAFLALVGTNKVLQSRCEFSIDNRLPIFITLRRYADELKVRKNLPLLDYILEVAKADFSMSSLDKYFYEYYIESGQSIILFDGLDELPSGDYKSIARQRIESFTDNYPENTIIITSRLVGYEAEIRFDSKYDHFRMAKLRESEIEKFIQDWYSIRIIDEIERNRNSSDLIRVIKHADNESIRTLAGNPLLLTIVTLVHRIDAVLPDQRVVLYQKCTETLLNTWYKAKRRDDDIVKGRIERRNRLRVEAIAYWMHKKSLADQGRAIAAKKEMIEFLTKYINDNEKIRENDQAAEDQAEVFLDFIKNSAGLIIEAGDELYSFIHLTFQEYLCATHLSTFGETGGTQTIWDELEGDLQNPRWREVVRLLVASLKSTSAQVFFIEKILSKQKSENSRDAILLLIGLLRDAIEPAEDKAVDIIKQTLVTLLSLKDTNDIRLIERTLSNWMTKDKLNANIVLSIFDEIFINSSEQQKIALSLIRAAIRLPQLSAAQKSSIIESKNNAKEIELLQSLIFSPSKKLNSRKNCDKFNAIHTKWALIRSESNAASVIGLCLSGILDDTSMAKKLLIREITLLSTPGSGPHHDHGQNLTAIAISCSSIHDDLKKSLINSLSQNRGIHKDFEKEKTIKKHFQSAAKKGYFLKEKTSSSLDFSMIVKLELDHKAESLGINEVIFDIPHQKRENEEDFELKIIKNSFPNKINNAPESYWRMLQSSSIFSSLFIGSIEDCFEITEFPHWREALINTLNENLPPIISKYLDKAEWERLSIRMDSVEIDIDDIYFCAWLILFDIWIWNRDGYNEPQKSPLAPLIEKSKKIENSLINFALYTRNIHLGIKNSENEMADLISRKDSQLQEILIAAGWPRHDKIFHYEISARKNKNK